MTRLQATLLQATTTILTCALAIPALAQNPARQIAAEQGFTLAAGVHTPFVLQTQPDAECDLHPQGDTAHTMRLYANAEGYVKVFLNPKQATQPDAQMQLDCTTASKVTTYPLRLRVGSSPTADMPAPQASVPAPKGAQVLPGLTDQTAKLLTDQELIGRGYPARPDAAAEPDAYEKWLDHVARPITFLPPHSVSRSDVSHSVLPEAGLSAASFYNWSGFEARGKNRTYMGVVGEWFVPAIAGFESNASTYSATWVGLDGSFGLKDLVQAGTEQDAWDLGPFTSTNYYAWTELLPNQPTENEISLSVNPGDDILVNVWIGDSSAYIDQNGGYAWFSFLNKTQHQSTRIWTKLGGTYFNGSSAEWIMERPTVGGSYSDLADYGAAMIFNAAAAPTSGYNIPSYTAANLQLYMANSTSIGGPDNNTLSTAIPLIPNAMNFLWLHFH